MAIITTCLKVLSMIRTRMAVLCFCLLLPPVPGFQVQAAQESPNCDALMATAEQLSAAEEASAQETALNAYKRALSCYGAAPTEQRARVLSKIARTQLLLSEYNEALETLQLALDDFRELPDQNAEVRLNEARVVGNRAYAQKMLGQMDQALAGFQESLNLFRDLRNAHYEAYTLEQIGLVYSIIGDTSEALSVYDDALKLRWGIGQKDKTNQQQIAAIFDLKGRVHAQLNDFTAAMANFHQALALAREAGYHEFVVHTLNDMGALILKQNRPALAEHYHQQALDYLKLHGSEAKAVAETQAFLGDAQIAQGKYDPALRNYHQALVLQERAKDIVGQAQTHFSLGILEAAGKHWPQAQESFVRAAQLYDDCAALLGESNARFRTALVLAAQHDVNGARRELATAIDLGEVIRILAPGPELRTSYFASVEEMYRAQIELNLKSREVDAASKHLEAFEIFQRAQSRTLLDALGEKMRTALAMHNDPEAMRGLQQQQQRLARLLGSPPNTDRKEILPTVRQIKSLLDQMEAESAAQEPRLGLFFNVVSAHDLQRRIIDADSALIQFYLAESGSYAWVITQSSVDLVQLPPKTILESNVRLALQFGVGGEWAGSQRLAAERLRRFFKPIFRIAHKKLWLIVPDGALHSFPFAMLTSLPGESRYPEEFVKLPSVPAIDMIRRVRNNPPPAYKLAIFADPVFDDLDSRINFSHSTQVRARTVVATHRSHTMLGDSLPRLRYTLKEAQDLSQLFPGGQSRGFLGFAATKEAASGDALQNFRIIHFATHSLPDARHPELSKIVLSRVKPDGSPQAGDLFAKDIYQMKLAADLVVLSSCRGAIGKQQPGEGPMSLSRAFLFAGSKAVVASLWEVNDQATAELMERFYHYMSEGKPPSTALTLAQSEFRKSLGQRQNPYFWAGFELYGEWMAY